MPCARERRPQAGSPDARGDAAAGGGRGRVGGASGGCRGVAGHGPGHGVRVAGASYREGGQDALRARPVPGRPPKLSGEQMRRLYTLIAGADPRQLEFGFALWTRDMVRTLIRREFQVSLSAVSVGRLLRTLGLVAAAAAVAGLAGRPRRRAALARRGVPGDPRAGQGRGGDDLLRRRGRDPLGLPRRHHLGPGRADPGGQGDRRPAQPEHDLRGHRARACCGSPPTPAASPAPGSSSSAAS